MTWLRRLSCAAGAAALALAPASPGAAQTAVESAAARCTDTGVPAAQCFELAVTARSLQGAVGLVAGLGSEVSGSASTLGRRLGTSPRIAVGARAAFAPVSLPDLLDPGAAPSREASFVVPAVNAGIALGVFDGFFLLPTVGGFLSLDLVGQTTVLFLPQGDGFEGKAASWSVGARLGIVRESFTLPGVSVSVSHRDVERVLFGNRLTGDGSVTVDPTVTSIRATVGKDLLSLGVMAGVGWDRYSGSAVLDPGPATSSVSILEESFNNSRRVIFGGISMNFLILQLSGEVGWGQGFGDVNGYRGTPFDASSGTAYGSLAFRLTL